MGTPRLGSDGIATPYFFRPPGYPLFLAIHLFLFGEAGFYLSIWTQRLAWLACVLLLFPLPRMDRRRPTTLVPFLGLVCGLLAPHVLMNVSKLLADAVFASVVSVGVHFLLLGFARKRLLYSVLSGISLGLAVLVKPAGLLLPLTLTASCLMYFRSASLKLEKRTITILLVFLCLSSVPVVTWSYRNYRLSGHFEFAPLAGWNLALHNIMTIKELSGEDYFPTNSRESEFARLATETENVPKTVYAIRSKHGLDIFEVDSIARNVALAAIWERPLRYLSNTVWFSVKNFTAVGDSLRLITAFWDTEPSLRTPLREALSKQHWFNVVVILTVCLLNLTFLLGIPTAILAAHLFHGRTDLRLCLILATGIYFVVVTSAFRPGQGRFLLPAFYSLIYLYYSLGVSPRNGQAPITRTGS